MTDTSICILAGGRSSRMREDKKMLLFRGETFLQRALRLAKPYEPRYVSLAKEDPTEQIPGFDIVRDVVEGAGPISGLVEALGRSPKPWVLFVPCDMPLLTPAVLSALASRKSDEIDAALFTENGQLRIFPLLLHKRTLPAFREALGSGRLALTPLLQHALSAAFIAAERESWYRAEMLSNINTKEDFAALQSRV